ncbi:MAG: hypothetical protein LUG99_03425 [Lachnospiraceae bacterium]|nr:hypothetical protein [Lachnospiraceae bacterium]
MEEWPVLQDDSRGDESAADERNCSGNRLNLAFYQGKECPRRLAVFEPRGTSVDDNAA